MKKNSYNSKRSFFKISILSFFATLIWKKITYSDYKIKDYEKKTGFRKINVNFIQRYGFNNNFGWLIKVKSGGHEFNKI